MDVVNYTWSFGAGEGTEYHEGALPGSTYHIYSSCGDKTVTLSGYSTEGLYGEVSKTVHVDCGPTAIARAIEANGTIITFNGTPSTYDTRPIVYYSWVFSDGQSGSSDDTAVTSRFVNDTVTAILTVSDGHCVDTDTV